MNTKEVNGVNTQSSVKPTQILFDTGSYRAKIIYDIVVNFVRCSATLRDVLHLRNWFHANLIPFYKRQKGQYWEVCVLGVTLLCAKERGVFVSVVEGDPNSEIPGLEQIEYNPVIYTYSMTTVESLLRNLIAEWRCSSMESEVMIQDNVSGWSFRPNKHYVILYTWRTGSGHVYVHQVPKVHLEQIKRVFGLVDIRQGTGVSSVHVDLVLIPSYSGKYNGKKFIKEAITLH